MKMLVGNTKTASMPPTLKDSTVADVLASKLDALQLPTTSKALSNIAQSEPSTTGQLIDVHHSTSVADVLDVLDKHAISAVAVFSEPGHFQPAGHQTGLDTGENQVIGQAREYVGIANVCMHLS
jgi:hypothetical protein